MDELARTDAWTFAGQTSMRKEAVRNAKHECSDFRILVGLRDVAKQRSNP